MARQSRAKKNDAIAILKADHQKVQKLFKEFEKLGEDEEEEKAQIAQQVCTELTVHAQIEEEIFYPAMREELNEKDVDLLDEAQVEHASAKELIAQIEDMEPSDELFDAKVTVLGEYVNHHVKEEQNEMFPKAQKSKADLEALGEQIMARKQELLPEAEEGEEEEESASRSSKAGKSRRR